MKMLRITRCSDSSMWYADKVGQLVPFEWEWPEGYASREDAGYINLVHFHDAEIVEVEATETEELDDDHPRWLVNAQICDLLEGIGASEDHENVISFFLSTGLPRGTVDRIHRAIVSAEVKSSEAGG